MHFFKKYVRIKIEDHKILVLMSVRSRNQDKRNAKNLHKYKRTISYIKLWRLWLELTYVVWWMNL